jgi:Transposase DDE domain group 1
MSSTANSSNAHYDERCFLPIHVYDTENSRPVTVVLRPGKTPGGVEVRAHLRRLVRHIRTRWHKTRITSRGDGHYARPEAMTWCKNNGIDYIFGLSGTKPLARKVDEVPTTSAPDARSRSCLFCAAIPRPATRPSPGIANGAPSPVLRRQARPRHPLRRHQPRCRLGRVDLRQPVLRARPSRESDQAA